MKELVGRLRTLDPEVTESLAVISYFDTLVDGRSGVETLLRGAATLSGVAAGYRRGAECMRVLADGHRGDPTELPGAYEAQPVRGEASVWLERQGAPHANDAMIRERLAISIAVTEAGRPLESSSRQAVELLLTESTSEQQRVLAAGRLQIAPGTRVRALAVAGDVRDRERPAATLTTPWGIARGKIVEEHDLDPVPSLGGGDHAARVGVGVAGPVGALPASWRTAVIALLLTGGATPVVRADDLGLLMHLTELVDGRSDLPPDVAVLDRLASTSWPAAALQAIADGRSIRAVAAAAALHHSTVHAKLPELARLLGYDPLTPLGRTRLYTGLLLQRIAHDRIDSGIRH